MVSNDGVEQQIALKRVYGFLRGCGLRRKPTPGSQGGYRKKALIPHTGVGFACNYSQKIIKDRVIV